MCSFELEFIVKFSSHYCYDLYGVWKIYGVHLFHFVYNFSKFF